MKKLFFIIASLLISCVAMAQDDNESILTTDIEIEGFENFWVQSRLSPNIDPNVHDADFRPARPIGGNVAFLSHVHTYTSKLFSALTAKYTEDMLARVGSSETIVIEFAIADDGAISIVLITNGTLNGFNADISRGIFDTYKKWKPATLSDVKVDSRQTLSIEISM